MAGWRLRCYPSIVKVELPSRAVNLAQARSRYGDLVDRFLPSLLRSDPLADAVADDFAELGREESRRLLDHALQRGIRSLAEAPNSLRRLFEQLDHVPVWVDWAAIDRASDVLFRTGFFGGTVLGAKSLVSGYCSPAGNKPLIFTGQLERRDRVGYRLAETSRFVVDVCERGGMRRYGHGFASTVRVRIMHAVVRRMIRRSGRFDEAAWGLPINQHDMVATTMLFSSAFLEGVRLFGFSITPEEAEDFMHLWRYNGWVIGVEPELLPTSEAQAIRLSDLITATQAPPDEDSCQLVRALVEAPIHNAGGDAKAQAMAKRQVDIGYGFTRCMQGEAMANALELPRTGARLIVPAIRGIVRRMERVGRRVPGYDSRLIRAGRTYWDQAIELGLAGRVAQFMPPAQLEGLLSAA